MSMSKTSQISNVKSFALKWKTKYFNFFLSFFKNEGKTDSYISNSVWARWQMNNVKSNYWLTPARALTKWGKSKTVLINISLWRIYLIKSRIAENGKEKLEVSLIISYCYSAFEENKFWQNSISSKNKYKLEIISLQLVLRFDSLPLFAIFALYQGILHKMVFLHLVGLHDVKWKPLNVITVNVIIRFILSVWWRPGHSSNFNSNKIRLMWS
jgi:hypothetical protein